MSASAPRSGDGELRAVEHMGVGETLSKQRVQVWDFAEIGDRLYLAGSFTDVQENETAVPISQPYLAAFDLDTGDYIPITDRIWFVSPVLQEG